MLRVECISKEVFYIYMIKIKFEMNMPQFTNMIWAFLSAEYWNILENMQWGGIIGGGWSFKKNSM